MSNSPATDRPFIPYHGRNRFGLHNVNQFWRIVDKYELEPFRPNPDLAPWHATAILRGAPYPIVIDFWPHKLKARVNDGKTVTGYNAICAAINHALKSESL